jgi:hypothetical protein
MATFSRNRRDSEAPLEQIRGSAEGKVTAGMTEVRRADPAARRQAVLFVVLGAFAGVLLILGFERYRIPLRNWLLSDPGKFALRVRLAFLLSGAFLAASLVAFAIYLWSFGASVLRGQQFPPSGYRLIRDTPIMLGQAAMSRGRGLKILALFLGVFAVLLCLLMWRLAWMI